MRRLLPLLASSLLALSLVLPGCATAPAPRALAIACDLAQAGPAYEGTCAIPCPVNALAVNFDGLIAARDCRGPDRTVKASLARTAATGRWLGTVTGVQPEDPTRFEIVPDKAGGGAVARMPFGWFAVTRFDEAGGRLRLVADGSRQVRPTADDLAILDRARALIATPAQWSKQDTRECPPGQARLSLFCALLQATTEISGGVHYRQPAMQAVREELNHVDPSRYGKHRLMDYNNHPATTLDEVHALLARARERVAREIR